MAEDQSENPKVFVLKRELSEVHLLLDNISSNPDNRLPLDDSVKVQGLPDEWIRKICEIDWPPDQTDDIATQASLLIKAKDYLNSLASPASGFTIAFTHLVTQVDGRRRRQVDQDGEAPTRSSMAIAAYPDLWRKAQWFKGWIMGMSIVLLIWLVLTCFLSWYVAYGNSVASEWSKAKAEYQKAIDQVEQTYLPSRTGTGATAGQASTTQVPASPLVMQPAEQFCAIARQPIKPGASGSPGGFASLSQLQGCRALDEASARLRALRCDCTNCAGGTADASSRCNAQVETLFGIIGNGVLPVFYGILGAGAAIIRSLSGKIKLSLLTPRDLILSLQRLALGAVMGACIGLFVSQPGAGATTGGGLGPVALSGSALSFIAGFGVDAVFGAIEGIINRIFSPQPAAPANSTPK